MLGHVGEEDAEDDQADRIMSVPVASEGIGPEARYTERTDWKVPGDARARHSGVFGSMICGECVV